MEPGAADLAHAISIAAAAHARQVDKSGRPYILHALRVMQRVSMHGTVAEMIAVLHDVVEDTWVTLDLLRQMGFSEAIIDGVDAISRRPGEEYYPYIARCAAHPIASLIKLADLADNSDPVRAFSGSASLHERYARARRIVEDAIASRTSAAAE